MKKVSFIKTIMIIALLYMVNLGTAQTPVTHYIGVYLHPEVCHLSAFGPEFIPGSYRSPYIGSGIGLYYQLEKKRFWFQAGLGYMAVFSTFIYGDIRATHANDPIIEDLLATRKVLRIGHAISIPVQGGYTFFQRPKCTMGVFGGLRWDVSVGSSIEQIYNDGSTRWSSYRRFPDVYTYFITGITFDYRPTERITLSAIPQIAYMMFTGIYPSFRSVNVGIRLQAGFRIP